MENFNYVTSAFLTQFGKMSQQGEAFRLIANYVM